MDLNKIPVEIIIDSLPQNRPLIKDSGLWQIYNDDLTEVIYRQGVNQSFRSFIRRYASTLLNDEIFCTELACNI
jgi:hypothetical protein